MIIYSLEDIQSFLEALITTCLLQICAARVLMEEGLKQ